MAMRKLPASLSLSAKEEQPTMHCPACDCVLHPTSRAVEPSLLSFWGTSITADLIVWLVLVPILSVAWIFSPFGRILAALSSAAIFLVIMALISQMGGRYTYQCTSCFRVWDRNELGLEGERNRD